MIGTLLWKEYREQRGTAIALAVFAVGLLVTLQVIGRPVPYGPFPIFATVAVCLVWMVGLVAGSQTFAGEVENRTLVWLDSQPMLRRHIGRTKIVFALLVTLLHVAILLGLGMATRWNEPVSSDELFLFMLGAGLAGLGCGVMASAYAQSALQAIGLAVAIESVLFMLWMLIVQGAVMLPSPRLLQSSLGWSALVCILLPFVIAQRRFTNLDRRRRRYPVLRRGDGRTGRALLWLVWRQGRAVFCVVLAAGLIAAIALPIGRSPPVWPAIGLVLGIVAGIGTFAADRPGDAHRFLGDRRLPTGRVWFAKSSFRLLIALAPTAMQLIGVAIFLWIKELELAAPQRHILPWLRVDFLLLGPLYGFAIGQFLGMICRKSAVAFVLSAMIGALVLGAWWPSLVIGGLHLWQWALPPILLIAMTRISMRPWTTGRLSELRCAFSIGATAAGATLLMIGGVAYRVFEAPVRTAPFDVAAFEATLPTPEQNQAALKLGNVLRRFRSEVLDKFVGTVTATDGTPILPWYIQAGQAVNERSWPSDDVELGQKLDEFASGPFLGDLRAATALPLGMAKFAAAHPFRTEYQLLGAAHTLSNLTNARALQLAARGELSEAFDCLFVSLDLSRHLRSKSGQAEFMSSAWIERATLPLFQTLVESKGANEELLKSVIARLTAHDRSIPPVTDTLKSDYIAALSIAKDGGIFPYGTVQDEWDPKRIAANAPWEHARSVRVLNTIFAGFMRTADVTYPDAMQRIAGGPAATEEWRHLLAAWTPPASDKAAPNVFRRLRELVFGSIWHYGYFFNSAVFQLDFLCGTTRRATLLQTALALYQLRHGKPAAELSQLVPEILAELPIDPYSLQPFHYRVSAGETINMYPYQSLPVDPAAGMREIPKGQGIIWSVGGDMQNDRGLVNGGSAWGIHKVLLGRDQIFLSPLFKKP